MPASFMHGAMSYSSRRAACHANLCHAVAQTCDSTTTTPPLLAWQACPSTRASCDRSPADWHQASTTTCRAPPQVNK